MHYAYAAYTEAFYAAIVALPIPAVIVALPIPAAVVETVPENPNLYHSSLRERSSMEWWLMQSIRHDAALLHTVKALPLRPAGGASVRAKPLPQASRKKRHGPLAHH